MSDVKEEVREQYNKYPYPSFSLFSKVSQASTCHASFEAGSSLVNQKIEPHSLKKIALLGCGTFEPYAQGSLHLQTQVDAVDLSRKSLDIARRQCLWRGIKNVNYFEGDLIDFCNKNVGVYDYVNCYGVLHHLQDPDRGFSAIASVLNPTGFARIMVYSATQRRRPQLLRNALKELGTDTNSANAPSTIRKLLGALPIKHPLKLSQLLNSDTQNRSGLIDSLLHACEHTFTVEKLKNTLNKNGLYLHAWDFSQNILSLLSDARGNNLEEQIHFLESFDQWPSPFTFWVSKNRPQETTSTFYRTNPHLQGQFKKNLPSTVLRTKLFLTEEEYEVLRFGLTERINSVEEKNISRLISARFLLRVEE